MAYKKYREMKVYEASGYQYKRTPSLTFRRLKSSISSNSNSHSPLILL